MPLREYMCLECGHVQENFERVPEDALTQCVQCESPKIERTITAMGGYHGNFGGSSTKPKNAGAFSGRKKSK